MQNLLPESSLASVLVDILARTPSPVQLLQSPNGQALADIAD